MVGEIKGKWPNSCRFVGAASRICSKQPAALLCSFHLAFTRCVSLASIWCIHSTDTVTNSKTFPFIFFFSVRSDFRMTNKLDWRFQKMICYCWAIWTGLITLRGDSSFLSKKKPNLLIYLPRAEKEEFSSIQDFLKIISGRKQAHWKLEPGLPIPFIEHL